ncbi:MAG: protein-glutamate O-methyltransferase CheR [Candidatus Hydrogenedentes bacterium]|nr:protein-glutamate O-methyltransferase CheR [Candidatus Hydrogenedentota bacterium]
MSTSSKISEVEFNLLRDYIEQHCGIALGKEKAYLIETRLTKLMALNGCESYSDFYRIIKASADESLKEKIIDAMTTNETLWFRDTHPFLILAEELLPRLAAEIKAGKRQKVRIWSAAASTGQEGYSIAMTIHEFCRSNFGVRPEHFEIVGTDISKSALLLAKAGRYDQLAMNRGMKDEIRDRYFAQSGNTWQINDNIKNMMALKKFNLQEKPTLLGVFDIVFIRYVLIYFSIELKRAILKNIHAQLAPGGNLLIGATESLREISEDFDSKTLGGGTYFTRK